MIKKDEITGVILAGGLSKRMGQDKAFLAYNDDLFITKIHSVVSNIFTSTIITSNETDNYLKIGLKNTYKDYFDNYGPLSGIFTALKTVSTPYIFITTCDLPLINSDIINCIINLSVYERINISFCGEDVFPLLGVYPVIIRDELEEFLIKNSKRKVFDFIYGNSINCKALDLTQFKTFLRNINTPSDYENLFI